MKVSKSIIGSMLAVLICLFLLLSPEVFADEVKKEVRKRDAYMFFELKCVGEPNEYFYKEGYIYYIGGYTPRKFLIVNRNFRNRLTYYGYPDNSMFENILDVEFLKLKDNKVRGVLEETDYDNTYLYAYGWVVVNNSKTCLLAVDLYNCHW